MSNHQRRPGRAGLEDGGKGGELGHDRGAAADGLSRRELLQAGVGASMLPPVAAAVGASALGAAPAAVAQAATAAAAGAGLFFSAAELALLDELTEMILPADEHSGGARAAAVATYLDRTLAEKDPAIPDHAEERQRFRDGLALVDRQARSLYGAPFLELVPAARATVLERLAANEEHPEAPQERFFVELKRATGIAYYSSRVGMIDDIGYKGNRVIREFVGTDVSKG